MNPSNEQYDVGPAGFPATRWSLVCRAGGGDLATQPIAIAELTRMYAPALHAHLLQLLRGDGDRADDLLQGFLADKLLEQRLVGHADANRGRFRTFLLAALDRYVIDTHRHDNALKRSPRGEIFDVDQQRDILPGNRVSAATDAFDLAWAREVIGEVLTTMRHQCDVLKRPDVWDVFEVRYLKPALEDVEPEAHESIAKRLNLGSAQQAANLLITAKRMFTRVFESVVSRYAANKNEIRDEVADLWRIFSAKKA